MKIQTAQGEVIVTNDGATILKHMAVLHPAAKMVCASLERCSTTQRNLYHSWSIYPRHKMWKVSQLTSLFWDSPELYQAGDGTTSVVVLAGSFLSAAEKMLAKGIHPTIISESFVKASIKGVQYLGEISTPVDLKDHATLLRAASTSLNSKVSDHKRRYQQVKNFLNGILDRLSVFIPSGTNCGVSCHPIDYPNIFQC